VEPTGWIGAILVAGSDKNAFSIYQYRSFQPAAHAQAVRRPIGHLANHGHGTLSIAMD
jgi:hypothetical protein